MFRGQCISLSLFFLVFFFNTHSVLFIILVSMFAICWHNATSAVNKRRMRLCSKKVKVCSRDNIDYHTEFELIFHSLLLFFFVLIYIQRKSMSVSYHLSIFLSIREEYQFSKFFFFFNLSCTFYLTYFLIVIEPKKNERKREREKERPKE